MDYYPPIKEVLEEISGQLNTWYWIPPLARQLTTQINTPLVNGEIEEESKVIIFTIPFVQRLGVFMIPTIQKVVENK